MARVTVEDCVDKVTNRFELCLASHRARGMSAGAEILVERDNIKTPSSRCAKLPIKSWCLPIFAKIWSARCKNRLMWTSPKKTLSPCRWPHLRRKAKASKPPPEMRKWWK